MPFKNRLLLACCFIGLVLMMMLPYTAFGRDELDEINDQINDLTTKLNQSIAATKPLESQLAGLKTQIEGIKGRVNSIDKDLEAKKKTIDDGYKSLEQKQIVLNKTIRDYYIKSYYNSPLLIFFSSDSASDVTRVMAYQRAAANQDKSIITGIVVSITGLEEKREQLKREQARLLIARNNLDEQSRKLDEVILGAKTYQAEVSGKIAALSSKQQEIVNARSGNYTFTIGNGELADEYLSSAKGFRESAPAGSFAIFSFGGYTHRKGMSQYGARGRAQNGQNYKQILQAYYGKEPVSKDTGGSIKVTGHGEMDFEGRYLLGIAEMPSSWHPEALKAQAVAARTYAYRYKAEGKEICTTESCQVFNAGKADNAPDSWKQAVSDTKGQVLEDVVTYYASTHGGYASPIGWDTTDGSGGSNFIDKAYDKIGGSPWLYKAWWRKGYSNSGDSCGRANPWLSAEEMADIVNAHLVMTRGNSSETSRVTPVTTSCWGGNPYSMSELREIASKYGGISAASSVSVSQGNGETNSVTINGISMSGKEFRNAVYLRAPGYIRIPQGEYGSGWAFFNVERK